MTNYFVGDEPGGSLTVDPASIPDAADYPDALAELHAPSGAVTHLGAAPGTTEDGTEVVTVDLAGAVFDEAGVWTLLVSLADDVEQRIRDAHPIRIPVEEPGSPWYLIDQAKADWQGAPDDAARLHDLLDVARDQVLAYAPALTDPAAVPARYRQAQLMQARNIWNAGITDPNSNQYGPDGYIAPVYPLDWSVKQMIRPRVGVPRVG